MNLKNLSFILILVLSFSVSATDVKLTETNNQLTITEKSLTEFTFINHLSEFQTMNVKTNAGDFVKLIVSGYGENAIKGNAELPVLEELFIIPIGAEISVHIINKEEKSISLSDYGITNIIFPSQPSISKSEDAASVPFYFNEEYYSNNDFYNSLISIKSQSGFEVVTQDMLIKKDSPITRKKYIEMFMKIISSGHNDFSAPTDDGDFLLSLHQGKEQLFSDIDSPDENHTAPTLNEMLWLQYAKYKNMVSGFEPDPGSTSVAVKPHQPITRLEAMIIIARELEKIALEYEYFIEKK